MDKVKVAIVEDVDNIRNSLREYISAQEEMLCIFAVESIESFFEKVADDIPDIVLCDIGLPGMNGIEGIKKIKNTFHHMNIIMLTVFRDNDKIFKAICAGANGYILKGTPLEEIKKAILDIREGGGAMSPAIARKVMEYFAPVKSSKEELLTAKEKQIVLGLTEGLSNKLLADKLSVSIHTVKFHLRNIYDKLHVNSKGEVLSKSLKGEI